MANHKHAKKAIRQIEKRTMINKNRVSRIRTFIRQVEEQITAKNAEAALQTFKIVQKELLRGANKGVVHKNTASRKISRLAHRIKTLAA